MSVTQQEMETVVSLIRRMSNEQLNTVSGVCRTQWDTNIRIAARQFRVGQRVAWTGKRGEMLGTIIKINPKMVRVKTDSMETWNVAGSLLRHVIAEGTLAVPK
jgi:phage gpG-like protein